LIESNLALLASPLAYWADYLTPERVIHSSCGRLKTFRLKTASARAAGLDPRSKTLDELEPDTFLVSTGNKRLDPFKAALADALKAAQEEN
jgi:hypothetical protein